MSRLSILLVAIVTGCATASAPVSVPDSTDSSEPEALPERVLDAEPLELARDLIDDGMTGAATALADSLWQAWTGLSELDPETVEDLSELLDTVGAEDRAAHLILTAPYGLQGGERKRLRTLAEELSIREIDRLLSLPKGRPGARTVLEAELAVALAIADHPERARAAAERVLDSTPEGDERDKAERVLQGRVEPLEAPIRMGIVLPASGRFKAVGEQILEGIRLAMNRHRAVPENPEVELVVLDDSSRVELGIEHVRTLEEMNVAAILGPLRSEALESAAIRRDQDELTLLSPTASGGQGTEPNAYTLWDRDQRSADVAAALGEWMADSLGIRSFGVLRPAGSAQSALEALRSVVEERGGEVAAAQAYPPDSTTFEGPITAIALQEPEAVIVFSDRARTVLQIAPQLVYYGLRRWVTAGDANWSDPVVVRRLDPSYADYRLVGTYVDRVTPGTAWQQFKAAYEAEYRKALPENMFAALGYDGMQLLLAGVPEAEWERRGAVGREIRRGVHSGATGDLKVDARDGELGREVFVRVIRDGELRVPDAAEMRTWAEEQLELEEFLDALEEEKEKAKEGSP